MPVAIGRFQPSPWQPLGAEGNVPAPDGELSQSNSKTHGDASETLRFSWNQFLSLGIGEGQVVPGGSPRAPSSWEGAAFITLALFSPVREQGGKFLAEIIGWSKDAVLVKLLSEITCSLLLSGIQHSFPWPTLSVNSLKGPQVKSGDKMSLSSCNTSCFRNIILYATGR